MTEYRTLRALARRASADDLTDAEAGAALEDWQAREATGLTRYLPAAEVPR